MTYLDNSPSGPKHRRTHPLRPPDWDSVGFGQAISFIGPSFRSHRSSFVLCIVIPFMIVAYYGDHHWSELIDGYLVGGLEYFFIFPYIGNNHPNWIQLTNIFQGGSNHQPVMLLIVSSIHTGLKTMSLPRNPWLHHHFPGNSQKTAPCYLAFLASPTDTPGRFPEIRGTPESSIIDDILSSIIIYYHLLSSIIIYYHLLSMVFFFPLKPSILGYPHDYGNPHMIPAHFRTLH